MKLTNGEKVVLKALIENGLEGMGGRVTQDLLEDNYSWFSVSDIVERTKYNKHQATGFMSSLSEKGILIDTEVGLELDEVTWCITDDGIQVAIELEVENEE